MTLLDTLADYLSDCYDMPVPVRRITRRSHIGELASAQTAVPATVVTCSTAVAATPRQLRTLLQAAGVEVGFVGWVPQTTLELVAIVDRAAQPPAEPAPDDFRVLAIIPTYNEADVIERTVEMLIGQGVAVHVLDNWSSDGTFELAQSFGDRGLVGLERFPASGPSPTYDLRSILQRVEEIAAASTADWCVLHDADERRRPPWRDTTLRDALSHVDRQGFSCIDHVTLTFHPIDNGYRRTYDLESYFRYFDFSDHAGHFHQRRAWKNLGQRVLLWPTAGHDVMFEERRVFPYRFLLKHYPIRSQAHGERKVLAERAARWNGAERALGWHAQYDQVDLTQFIRHPDGLERFDAQFDERRVVERVSAVGVFARPPAWATSPRWRDRAGP